MIDKKVCRSRKKSKLTKLRLFLSFVFVLSIALNIQNYIEKENILKLIDKSSINAYDFEFMRDVCKRVDDNRKQKRLQFRQ